MSAVRSAVLDGRSYPLRGAALRRAAHHRRRQPRLFLPRTRLRGAAARLRAPAAAPPDGAPVSASSASRICTSRCTPAGRASAAELDDPLQRARPSRGPRAAPPPALASTRSTRRGRRRLHDDLRRGCPAAWSRKRKVTSPASGSPSTVCAVTPPASISATRRATKPRRGTRAESSVPFLIMLALRRPFFQGEHVGGAAAEQVAQRRAPCARAAFDVHPERGGGGSRRPSRRASARGRRPRACAGRPRPASASRPGRW